MLPLLRSLATPGKPEIVAEGSLIALEPRLGFEDTTHPWRVRSVRSFLGVPHASLEQVGTGKTKTLAVSAIVRQRGFRIIRAPEGSSP